jgi:membrane-associated phospholipid phosphatase
MPFWFWLAVSRLGEAQLLLPALLTVVAYWAWRSRAPWVAACWLWTTAAAALLTTASKIAFLGWGLGSAGFDFTGISGHAMFAAAILPLLACEAVAGKPARWRVAAVASGYVLAALVGVSRVELEVHSASEVWAGLLLGCLGSGLALWWAPLPNRSMPKRLTALWAAWLLLALPYAPPSPLHGWVTAVSLSLSGRSEPYTREMLLRQLPAQLEAVDVPFVLADLEPTAQLPARFMAAATAGFAAANLARTGRGGRGGTQGADEQGERAEHGGGLCVRVVMASSSSPHAAAAITHRSVPRGDPPSV